ncbi:hypothetical protein GQ55_2G331700 [Panicum hallii var. hallii]|uniref:DUF8204 domain-containing protein n=1 Tax=Panicum hallii var. hallii TaxID=1504633 RepID=A0A2T7EV05_9POAL|nr:hypothetical protein GQ55_2G331700 [Panicum hallii var. hallii]
MGEASPESGGAAAGGAAGPVPPRKGKSCKGCLYYSSVLKSRGYNPICVGIPRSISQVPNYVVDEPKEEAMSHGHDLRQFRYGCAGYSMYVDNRDSQGGESEGKTLLPYCRGLELLADSRLVEKKPSTAEQAPAHVSNDAATARSHQQGQQRPAHLARQEFLGRFKRSAGLVASGVAKNLNKTANYIKENIQDIVYPDRRPPK